jgi:hypothetical protein
MLIMHIGDPGLENACLVFSPVVFTQQEPLVNSSVESREQGGPCMQEVNVLAYL